MVKAEQREIRQGFGDAMAAAFELAVTPAIFGFLGWMIDRKLEVFPLFTLVFVLVTVTYATWRLYQNYSLRLDEAAQERRSTWLLGKENAS